MNKSIAAKISGVILSMIAMSSLATGLSGYIIYRGDAVKQGAERALDIAKSAAAAIDPIVMESALETTEESDGWIRIKTTMDGIKQSTGVKYLYVLGAQPTAENNMVYFVEGYDPANAMEEEFSLGDEESADIYDDLMFYALESGQSQVSEVYESGEFGRMVSGFVPVLNGTRVIGVVGVDISVEDVMSAANRFGLLCIPVVVVACIVFGLVSMNLINRVVGKPIRTLTKVSDDLAEGMVNLQLDVHKQDEIGQLADSFRKIMANTRTQAAQLDQLADGDLTIQPVIRNDKDAMNIAMNKMIEKLNQMLAAIHLSSEKVATTAVQLSSASQSLADNSTNQSSVLESFSKMIAQVYEQAEENARQAANAMERTRDASALMSKSNQLMGEMGVSMEAISDSSQQISNVIKVIDDIAFQTNILALNAAVEAARAGQHGKGFAVVADEVRNLASKSAAAAKETSVLIESSGDKVDEGNRIAASTGESLREVDGISLENAAIMERINGASMEQTNSISAINERIGKISTDVQHSAAIAQQSAASAHEMSMLAEELERIVGKFRLRKVAASL